MLRVGIEGTDQDDAATGIEDGIADSEVVRFTSEQIGRAHV